MSNRSPRKSNKGAKGSATITSVSQDNLKLSNLDKNADGTLKMERFYDLLPQDALKEKMTNYLDLDVLFLKLKYNPIYNNFANSQIRGGKKAHEFGFEGEQLEIVWDDDSEDNKLNGFRIIALLMAARHSLRNHLPCEELSAPAFVFTDLHGQHSDQLRWFSLFGGPEQQKNYNYVICGDSVDRGPRQMETTLLLLYYKVRYPTRFFFLKGNHEDFELHSYYGFYREVNDRVKKNVGDSVPLLNLARKVYFMFIHVFDLLPCALILDRKIFCVHGGISPVLTLCHLCDKKNSRIIDICELPNHIGARKNVTELINLLNTRIKNPSEIGTAYVGVQGISDHSYANVVAKKNFDNYGFILSDLLWADPTTVRGVTGPTDTRWTQVNKTWDYNNSRKISFVFGTTAIAKFLKLWELTLIIRGHDMRMEGYEWHYQKNLITVFSAPGYGDSKANNGGVAMVSVLSEGKRRLRVDPIVLKNLPH